MAPVMIPLCPLCGACVLGYFSRDGVCTSCTTIQGPQHQSPLGTLAFLLIGVLGVFGVLVVVLTRAFRVTRLPTTRSLGVRIAAEVTVWFLSTLQVFIQLTRTASPGLSPWLRRVFSYVQALESDVTGVLPAGCSGGSPFLYTQAVCSLALAFTVLFAILGVLRLRRDCKMRATLRAHSLPRQPPGPGRARNKGPVSWLQFLSSVAAVLLYGPALAKSWDTLCCVTVMRPVATAAGVTLLPARVWELDTRLLCYEGDHAIAAGLAWPTLVLVGLGLPLLLFVAASLNLRAVLPYLQSVKDVAKGGKDAKAPFHSIPSLPFTDRTVGAYASSRKNQLSCHEACCAMFRTLPEEQHQPLRQYRAWAVIYGYGQPWVRPASVTLTLCVTALSSALPPEEFPLARAVFLGVLLVAAAVACVWPSITLDHQWSAWKRWPRALSYATSAGLVALQCVIALSKLQATTGTAVIVLSWAVVTCVASLPLVLVASLVAWLTSMLSCRAFWCCCCGSRCLGAGVRAGSRRGLFAMLAFTMSFGSETPVLQLVRHAGASSVVTAMVSPRPASSLQALQASIRMAGQVSIGGTSSLEEGNALPDPAVHPRSGGSSSLASSRELAAAAHVVEEHVSTVATAASLVSKTPKLDDLHWDTATQNPLYNQSVQFHPHSRGVFTAVNPLRLALQGAGANPNKLGAAAYEQTGTCLLLRSKQEEKEAASAERAGARAVQGFPSEDVTLEPQGEEEVEGIPNAGTPGSRWMRFRFGAASRRPHGHPRKVRDSNAIYSQLVRRKVGDVVAKSLKSYAKDIATRSNRVRKEGP